MPIKTPTVVYERHELVSYDHMTDLVRCSCGEHHTVKWVKHRQQEMESAGDKLKSAFEAVVGMWKP